MKFSRYQPLGNDLLKNSPSSRETKGLNEACQPLKISPSRSRDRKFDMHDSLLKSPPPGRETESLICMSAS